jgi:hypothetical protein
MTTTYKNALFRPAVDANEYAIAVADASTNTHAVVLSDDSCYCVDSALYDLRELLDVFACVFQLTD